MRIKIGTIGAHGFRDRDARIGNAVEIIWDPPEILRWARWALAAQECVMVFTWRRDTTAPS